jgi:hypothetical protein
MFAAISSVISRAAFFDNSYDSLSFSSSNHSYYGSFLSFCFVGQNSIEFSIGKAVSSIDKRLPKFSGKISQSFCVWF